MKLRFSNPGFTFDGTPYEMKVSRTVWRKGKASVNVKSLPISIYFIYKAFKRESARLLWLWISFTNEFATRNYELAYSGQE